MTCEHDWPANDGFDGQPRSTQLEIGEIYLRFGKTDGRYLTLPLTPIQRVTLPCANRNLDPRYLLVTQNISGAQVGKSVGHHFCCRQGADCYQPGGGRQILLPFSVSHYIGLGHIRELSIRLEIGFLLDPMTGTEYAIQEKHL
jgi:hypothetical protein